MNQFQSVFDFFVEMIAPTAKASGDETGHLKPSGRKKRKKRHLTVAQLEAKLIHRTDYGQPPVGHHPALGCGCVLHQLSNGRHCLDACALHSQQNNPSPFFDEPEYWSRQKDWAAAERRKYYALPMEMPSEGQISRALSRSLPWERAWGNPRRMLAAIFNLDNSQGRTCGCLFEVRILDVPRRSEERRIGHFFYAVRVAPCKNAFCVWDHLPLKPKFGHNPWRKN